MPLTLSLFASANGAPSSSFAENELWKSAPHIGIDEAGRGCLAGPVVAAAVFFVPEFDYPALLPGLDDSKKLSESARGALADLIRKRCAAFGLGLAWQDEIDGVNIRNATFRAMARAVFVLSITLSGQSKSTKLPPLIIDGNAVIPASQWRACECPPAGLASLDRFARLFPPCLPNPMPDMPEQQAVVGGDALVPAISAASVLAKTVRDALLTRLEASYSGYGLARHKGYGTKDHLAAIAQKGPCELHRKTFRKVRPEPRQAEGAGEKMI